MARTFKTVSPVDGRVYLEREFADDAAVDTALTRAADAFQHWKRVPLAERQAICQRFVTAIEAQSGTIAEELTWQIGRPLRQTPGEVRGLAERARTMIELAPAALEEVQVGPKPGFERYIRREPLGVVLTVAAWNYPYLIAVNSVVPAILAGNVVVLKHSTQTPLCAEQFAAAWQAAQLPEGVFQYLHVDHQQTARMVGDPRVAYVAFTGSVAGGHAMQQAAAQRFIGMGLELGGKDPAYVRADAPWDHTVENLVDGVYFNSGQSCCGIERIYVDRQIYPQFVDAFVALTRQYRLGNPLDDTTNLGPLVRTSAADFVRRQIREAVEQGAKAWIDPRDFAADREGTPYLAPQVLTEVNHRMSIMTEESFGPVVGIMPVDNDDEAIRWMNDSQYGLTASIWTSNLAAAQAIGDRLDTGTVFMNRCDYLDPSLAWVGVKDSGRGCTLSRVGFEQLTRPKSYHLRHTLNS